MHRLYAGFDELLELEAVLQQERVQSADFIEGVIAFLRRSRRRASPAEDPPR